VAILNEEIDRVGKIIDEFAELNIPERSTAADPGKVIADVVRLFRHTEYASAPVQIENRLKKDRYELEGSADTLKQIFVNLVKNAAEAMTHGGLIEIGSDGLVNRDGVLYLNLWVKDNGPGIADEIMGNLFSPVQSSKGMGHRGLGLNIVHGLVKKMQGLISCKSTAQGTTFEILFPAAQNDVDERVTSAKVETINGQLLA
jgi:signal transduction histidine kinase